MPILLGSLAGPSTRLGALEVAYLSWSWLGIGFDECRAVLLTTGFIWLFPNEWLPSFSSKHEGRLSRLSFIWISSDKFGVVFWFPSFILVSCASYILGGCVLVRLRSAAPFGIARLIERGERMPSLTVSSPLIFRFFCSSSTRAFHEFLFAFNSSTQNFIAGMMSLTSWKRGIANIFIKPSCD